MASVPEQRNIIVQQNIPKLIKSLTGLKVSLLFYFLLKIDS